MSKEMITMKMLQRVYQEDLTMAQGEQLAERMPQWISSMGLEWLHEFVLKTEILLKAKAPRQS